jgi:HK97 family phage portal protein
MDRGLITLARDWLFQGWASKAPAIASDAINQVGWVGMPQTGDAGAVRPGSYESQIAANKRTIHACVSLISDGLAKEPLRVYRKKGRNDKRFLWTQTREVKEPRKSELLGRAGPGSILSTAEDLEEIVAGHRLVDLLHNVSGYLDNYALKFLTVAYLKLLGNGYWVLMKDGMGIPESIWIAPAEYMKVLPDKDGSIAGYKYKHGTVERKFEADEVIHFKLPAPGAKYQFYGRGDLMGAADAYNLSQYIQTFETALFNNGGIPAVVISTGTHQSEQAKESLLRQYNQRFTGAAKQGKAVIGENLEIKQLGLPPRELAYQSSRKVLLEEMAANMGVPVALLTGQSTTRAALEASLTQFAMFTIAPMCILIDETLNAQLAPLYRDPVAIYFDNPVPEDKEFGLKKSESDLKMGVTTIDEERISQGKEPFGGMAAEAMVDIGRTPLSMAGQMRPGITQEQVNELATRGLAEARRRRGK